MKALTLTQPWASLMAMNYKGIETRSWRTPYRGGLAIHAAKGFPKWAREFAEESPLVGEAWKILPRGTVICVVELLACVPTEKVGLFTHQMDWKPPENWETELKLGNYAEGRYAWVTRLRKVFNPPIPATGALSLWEWKERDA